MKETDYTHICKKVNGVVDRFNEYLADQYHINHLSPDEYLDDNKWAIPGIGSDYEHPGVYIFIYSRNTDGKPFLYIGKSSTGLGNRLWARFRLEPGDFELCRVYTFNLSDIPTMSSALEEFLISNLREEFSLSNKVGNRS